MSSTSVDPGTRLFFPLQQVSNLRTNLPKAESRVGLQVAQVEESVVSGHNGYTCGTYDEFVRGLMGTFRNQMYWRHIAGGHI